MRVTINQCRVVAYIDHDEFTTIPKIMAATGLPEVEVRSALRSLRRIKMGGFSRNGCGYVSHGYWPEDDGYDTLQWMIAEAQKWAEENGRTW